MSRSPMTTTGIVFIVGLLLGTARVAGASTPLRIGLLVDTTPTAQSLRWEQFTKAAIKLHASLREGDVMDIYAWNGTQTQRCVTLPKGAKSESITIRHQWRQTLSPLAGTRCTVTQQLRDMVGDLVARHDPNVRTAIVILLNQSLAISQAQILSDQLTALRRANWPVCLAGPNDTHPLVLTASQAGILHYQLISDIDAQRWIESWREPVATDASPQSAQIIYVPQPVSPAPAAVELTDDQIAKLTSALRDTIAEQRDAVMHVLQTPDQPSHVNDAATTPAIVDVPKPTVTSTIPDTTSGNAEMMLAGDAGAPANTVSALADEESTHATDYTDAPTFDLVDDLGSTDASPRDLNTPTLPTVPDVPHADTFDHSLWWRILIPGAAALTAFFLVQGRAGLRAQRWRRQLTERIASPDRLSERWPCLVARYASRQQDLGRIDRLPRSLHIGSAPGNSIRILHDSVRPRHVRLLCKGGQLWLWNLAWQRIEVNGDPLRPRRRRPLHLPATIAICDDVTIGLSLIHKETPHGEEAHSVHAPSGVASVGGI